MFRDLAWRLAVRDISAQSRQAANKVRIPEFAGNRSPVRSISESLV
jgi:hypothetical protein